MRQLENSAQIFNALSDVPGDVQDVDELINVRFIYFLNEHISYLSH